MSVTSALAVGPDYGFGLYIHWPYCTRICPYCDFNVYAAKQRDTEPLITAMLEDIKRQSDALTAHPPLQSIFFGGGTPSLLSPGEMQRLIDAADKKLGLTPDCEITVEANPNDVVTADLRGWASAGINRVSLGIQSLDNAALSFLGRDHDSDTALRAVADVQKRFNNYSLDFIYALPDQSLGDWDAQLSQALALGAPHLSLYELTIEPATPFGKRAARGTLTPMPDEVQADMYELTQSLCTAAGVPAYEVSNHAATPQFEARHNHIYWASGDWLGIGPGAHGRLTRDSQRYSTEAPRRPQDYIANTTPEQTRLSDRDTALEFVAMGLRPTQGIDRARYAELFGAPISETTLETLIDAELVKANSNQIRLTEKGRLLADYVSAHLV